MAFILTYDSMVCSIGNSECHLAVRLFCYPIILSRELVLVASLTSCISDVPHGGGWRLTSEENSTEYFLAFPLGLGVRG